jgi:uncharacterized protein YdeI (YjbR/CyaY-like superfamily)
MSDVPVDSVHPKSRAEWRQWLSRYHKRTAGVWLVTFKKATGKPRVPYDDAVEEALCFGWIDSKPRALDAERSMLWFAPRKAGSGWSAPNKRRVEKMTAQGRMAPAGIARVEAARADGSWSALDAVEALEIPPDLGEALDRHPRARGRFEAFPRSAKRGILEWIVNARRPETRARRVEETARLASRNTRANQWPRPTARAARKK